MATHPRAPLTRASLDLPRLDPVAIATWGFALVALLLVALMLAVAIFLPYGDWDAMSFGTWSRLIAVHWPHLRFSSVGPAQYHRPLFYVLQGLVWAVFGFHPALGRLLSLGFSLLLVGAVAWLAFRTARIRGTFAAALAVLVVLLITAFERYATGGLSDIPVAALVATTAALLLSPRLGRAQLPLVGLSATLAVLAKPSSLPALAGLGAAVLIGPRAELRRRGAAVAAIVAGSALGIVYDVVQAGYVHLGLYDFLTVGTRGFYAQLADHARRHVLLDGSWLGADLRLLLAFALLYALARLALGHRTTVAAALPLALAWSWLGPHLAGASGLRAGILATGGWPEQTAVLVLAASLLLALAAPDDAVPTRLQLARGLVWAAPPTAAWAARVVYDDRLLAPAWTPLVLLIVWSLLPAYLGAVHLRRWLVLVPAAAAMVVGVYAANGIDGLGPSGWRAIRAGGVSGLRDAALMRNVALGGDFSSEVNALAPQVGPRDRILTYDLRLQYFYLGRVDFAPPLACSQLRGYGVFVLLESDEVRTLYGDRAGSAFWQSCSGVTEVAERPGAFAIFVRGAPAATTGGCGAPPPEAGLAVQFGPTLRTEASARRLLARLVSLGFVQARVEQLGCASYRVGEHGVPDAKVGASVVAEARSAGIEARVVGP